MDNIGLFITTFIAIGIILGILLREFANWYWKHNEMIELMKSMNIELKEIKSKIK